MIHISKFSFLGKSKILNQLVITTFPNSNAHMSLDD